MKRLSVITVVATATVVLAYLATSRATARAAQGPTGTAKVVVRVTLSGSAPAPAKIQTSADPYCAKVHQAEPLLSQTVEVGADGALMDALVFVKDGVTGTYAAPQTPVTLDQRGCVYIPHVIGLIAGQPLQIINSQQRSDTPQHPPVACDQHGIQYRDADSGDEANQGLPEG
jgi:hypothetical protein